MANFFLLLILLVPHFAFGDAVIFSGNDVKTLKSNIDMNGNAKLLSGTVDPSSVATSAPAGSLYLNTSSGNVYKKNDSGLTTNWSVLLVTGGATSNGATSTHVLQGGASPMYPIDGIRRATANSTITKINVSALNSGSSGSTTVKLYYGPSLGSTQTATLTANGGVNSSSATVSLALTAGDLMAVELVSAAAGGVEDVTVELVY